MNAAQITRARMVAEESDDGQIIRDLCDALEDAKERALPKEGFVIQIPREQRSWLR